MNVSTYNKRMESKQSTNNLKLILAEKDNYINNLNNELNELR